MFRIAEFLRRSRLPSAIVGGLMISAIFVFAFNATASAQSPSAGLIIEDITITDKGETEGGIAHQARVTFRNSNDSDFSGLQRVDYTIDGGEPQLAFIVTQIDAGASTTFTVNFNLTPGEHTINVILGDSEVSKTVSVEGADIAVRIIEHRPKRGRTVELVVAITNVGKRQARDLSLKGAWQGDSEENTGEKEYDGVLQNLASIQRTTIVMPLQLATGTYEFSFEASTSSLENDYDNNSATAKIDVDYVDLQVQVLSVESLGWNADGNGLMSLNVEIENSGVEDMNSFYIGIDCLSEWSADCSSSNQLARLPAGTKTSSEFRLWLPVGDTPSTIFAVENEDTFRWGRSNVVGTTITTPPVPEQVWTLARTSEPDVASYWSDGSANVDLDLTFLNNGTDDPSTVSIQCTQKETAVDGCSGSFDISLVEDVYPTVVHRTLRLPHGETALQLEYGASEPTTLLVTVPERIVGVDRDVWACFTDTSFLDETTAPNGGGAGTHLTDDLGIGCAGWDETHIKKWPVGKTIDVWVSGEQSYVDIFEDVLQHLALLLNLDIAYVGDKSEADLVAFTGWSKGDADTPGLACVEFAGCAQNKSDSEGNITGSKIVIWTIELTDEARQTSGIRATTLHELLHSLTGVNHRHHDRTSVMSYESLDYTTIDGIDLGLYEILASPLVEPGMSFDEVAGFIVFADELNDPPEPEELTSKQILRRAHATWMDADTVSYEVKGAWPDCNYHFGWGRYEFGNLKPSFPLWQRFEHGSFHYYLVGHPTDRDAHEYWLKRGQNWQKVQSTKVFDITYFRSGFTNPFAMLSNVNIYAEDSNYKVISRSDTRLVLEIVIDGPNPSWSRKLDLRIRIDVHPETFEISNYKMTWNFSPRQRDSCDNYTVEGRNPTFGQDFTFPDEILQESQILQPQPITSDYADDSTASQIDPLYLEEIFTRPPMFPLP